MEMDNKDEVNLGEGIRAIQEKDVPWDTVLFRKDNYDEFLIQSLKKDMESYQKKEIKNIETLRFENIEFKREDDYSRLEIFAKVNCLQFVGCKTCSNETLNDSVLSKICKNLAKVNKLHFENEMDKFLTVDPKEEKISTVKTLCFKRIDFKKEDDYSRLKIFAKVNCLQFLDCLTYSSESACDSVLSKISKALAGIKELHFENARVVYMCNVDTNTFKSLKTLKLKKVGSLAWKEHDDLKLEHLSLDNVSINAYIVKEISKINSLVELELSAVYHGNDANEVLSKLSEIKKLTTLKLSKMPIGKQPEWIAKLTELKTLELSNLKIGNFIIVNGNPNLDNLVLDNNPITTIDISSLKKINKLSIANTNVTKLPSIDSSIMELNCSGCKKMDWENFEKNDGKKSYLEMFGNLIKLNISHNDIKKIPKKLFGSDENIQLGSLEWLNISDTEFKELPFQDQDKEIPNLRCLIAENMRIEQFPDKILRDDKWSLHYKNYNAERIYKRFARQEKNIKRAYLRGTMAKGISPHFFTGGYKITRTEFWSYDHEPGHQATIVFLGEKNQKTRVICSLFDVSISDLIVCGDNGQTLVNTKAQLQVADPNNIKLDVDGKKERLASDTELKIWTLSQGSEYRSGHGMFMPNNALYVIVVDAESELDLQRKADFWFRFVRYSVGSADILFLLLKKTGNDVEAINLEKYKRDSHCHVHSELAYMTSDENDDLALDKARGILTHAIQRLPSYRGKVIVGWKRALRHISEILEARPSLSYICKEKGDVRDGRQEFLNFDHICNVNFMEKKPSAEMKEVFRTLLTDAGICYDDGDGNLYSLAWISCFVYATMKYAAEKHGEITIQELKMYLLENVEQYDYFDSDIKKLLETLAASPHCPKKNQLAKMRAPMCIRLKSGAYLFPQFAYICERQYGPLEDKSHKEISKQKEWTKKWSERLTKFRNSRYVNRYIIDMPLLSDGLLVDITCRLLEILRDVNEKQLDANKMQLDVREKVVEIERAIGADGLMAHFVLGYEDLFHEYCLLVDGVPSAPGRLQILVGKYSEKKPDENSPVTSDTSELPGDLVIIRDLAFRAFFDAIKENAHLMINMRTYLALPNYYLPTQYGTLHWPLALRDIYYCKKYGKDTFDYLEGSLSMDILGKFIPEPFEATLEKALNLNLSYKGRISSFTGE